MQRQTAINLTDPMGRLRADLTSNNCNAAFAGPRDNVDWYHTLQTCRQLETYTNSEEGIPFERNNFVAIEVPLYDSLPCPHWRTFAVMRNPVERVLSNMRYHRQSQETVMEWIDNPTIPTKQYLPEGYSNVNCMVIRQLLGRDRFLNVTSVNEMDLRQAKQLVDKFDAFVPLEYLLHENVTSLLKQMIPEYYDKMAEKPLILNRDTIKHVPLNETFLKLIAEENYYDSQLYMYVLSKFGIKGD